MITVLRSVHCEARGCGQWLDAATDITAAELRKEAARDGWSRRQGQDFCERCTTEARHGNR